MRAMSEPTGPALEPVGGSGRRRALAALLAMGGFAALVLLRPWPDAQPQPASHSAAAAAIATASAHVPPAPSPSRADGVSLESASGALASILEDRDAWGIRAIVAGPGGGPQVEEVWAPFGAGDPSRAVLLRTGEAPVLAIGVTSPPAQTPLDVRVWRAWGEQHHFVPVDFLDLPGTTDDILLPPENAGDGRVWQPGRYVVQLLLPTSAVRADIEVPGKPEPVPAGRYRAPLPSSVAVARELGGVGYTGALALLLTERGTPTLLCVDGSPGRTLDGAAAWLAVRRGVEPAAPCFGSPQIDGPHAFTLVLPDGHTITSASLVRLDPVVRELGSVPPLVAPLPGSPREPSKRVALFRNEDGRPWPPGTYRIDAEWRDRDGEHSGSWLLNSFPSTG
jgi:hypothetical protein